MWAYAKLGVRPPQMLLVALWESVGIMSASGSSDSSYGGSSGSGVYGTTAIPGSSSSGSVGARLSAFKPQELTMLVWALAVLKLVPGTCLREVTASNPGCGTVRPCCFCVRLSVGAWLIGTAM